MQIPPVTPEHVDVLTQLINGTLAAIPGGALAIVLWQLLKTQIQAMKELSLDFRKIVTENTEAMTENTEVLRNVCKYSYESQKRHS